jgi:RNA polymerase sigma factor (sigma-70 family)
MTALVLNDQERLTLEGAYREYGGDLWRALLAFAAGNREIADDGVAHAFIEAGARMHQIRDLRSWLYAVAFRAAAADLRRGRAVQEAGVGSLGDPATYDGQDRLVEILDLVRSLSPRQRAVFVLRELFGYPTTETATLLGTSETAVRVHLHGARRRLRARIEEAERA